MRRRFLCRNRGLNRWLQPAAVIAVALLAAAAAPMLRACPFCNAAMQTLGEEIMASDMAVIAEVASPNTSPTSPVVGDPPPAAATAGTKFRVVQTLRGEDKIAFGDEITAVYFGTDPPGKKFLLSAIKVDDKSEWTTPIPLSDRAVDYVTTIPTLPPTGVERIAFFQEHLEDPDPLLAQDSYDEFSRAPYADVIALGPQMHRDKLLAWIDDANVGPTGRRLYLTMLGVCAKPDDVKLLESMLNYDYAALKPAIAAAIAASAVGGPPLGVGLVDEMVHQEERRRKESLDALAACYLKLTGPTGLELLNERFLGNPKVEYKYLHAIVMALRFHGEQTDVLPRKDLVRSIRLCLDHEAFADQVIPDLARWNDWEAMPRLVEMFNTKDPERQYIRQSVASYLLVAAEEPGQVGADAKQALEQAERIDPEAVEMARKYSAFALMPRTSARPAETPPDGSSSGATRVPPTTPKSESSADLASTKAAGKNAPPSAPLPAAAAPVPPNRFKIIGVPILAAVILLAVFAVLLRGSDPRSSDENS